MELIYNVNKLTKSKRDWGREESPLCCLSAQNLIAFCSTSDLLSRKRDHYNAADDEPMETCSGIVSNHHIYICDIDKPWDVFRVTCLPEPVVALEWHLNGIQLLIATEHGLVQVWQMEELMINQWKCSQTVNVREDIISMAWFHQGNKMTFNAEKRENIAYPDKIMRTPFKPSLSYYGGKPIDGWLVITATGLVCACLPPLLNKDNNLIVENLSKSRTRIQLAHITHNSNGDILLVTSDGNLSSMITCFGISLKIEHGLCAIECRAMPSLFAKCHTDPSLKDSMASRITHVQFLHKDAGDVLLIAAGNTNASHIELWHLTNDIIGLNRTYASNIDPDSTYCTQKWVYQSAVTQSSLPVSIATPRFPIAFNNQDTNPSVLFQYIAVSYRDGSLKLVNRHTFQAMATTNLDYGIELNEDGSEKRRRIPAHITSMQQTFTGCGLVGIDQYNCLYAMKVVNTRDPVTQVPVVYLVGILEYLIYTGYDWWDVLAALKPGIIENVISKMSDNFAKQSSSIQELLFTRFMAVRGSLYRCSPGSRQRAADCHCKLVLHSVSTLFKTVLRPKFISSQELNPAEKLTNTCNLNSDCDITKLLKALNLEKNKPQFVIDLVTLQALQQLIQWVANLVLYLLSSLPMAQGYNTTFAGSLLLRDLSVLGTLRELLLIIKFWGLMHVGCLPTFTTTTADMDCLSTLFRILTRVWLTVKEGGGIEFDEKLVDECCLLPSKVLIPPVDQGLFGDTCYQASIFSQSHPIQYYFTEKPAHANKSITDQAPLPEGQVFSQQKKDIVRQIYLGVKPSEPVRVCSRCDSLSLLKNVAKSPTMMAWELKFTKSCLCGGHWKLST